VFEVVAAAAGASITAIFMAFGSYNKRVLSGQECLTRLSMSVDNVAERLEELHQDLRSERTEIFSRLAAAEKAIARLEAVQRHH
jgi:hypothetical protein